MYVPEQSHFRLGRRWLLVKNAVVASRWRLASLRINLRTTVIKLCLSCSHTCAKTYSSSAVLCQCLCLLQLCLWVSHPQMLSWVSWFVCVDRRSVVVDSRFWIDANSHTYYYLFSITHSLFHSRLKTFLFCKCLLLSTAAFLFLLQDWLHDSPDFYC